MKIVSDFDGVFTNPVGEGQAIFEDFLVASQASSNGTLSRRDILKIRDRQLQTPWLHGWNDHGRLTAYCNEDPFIALIALSEELGLRDIASQCFHNVRASALHVEPSAIEAARKVISAGHELVIVSNSSPERISKIVGNVLPEGIHVRGNARKFVTTAQGPELAVGQYKIPLTRPDYEKILSEEKPELVIGDVYSLDLAYPLHLRKDGVLPNLQVALIERPYTPEWSKVHVSKIGSHATIQTGFAEAVHKAGLI